MLQVREALNNAVPDAAVIAAIRENILNVARAAPPLMAGFVQRWMDDLGAKERKKLSYLGVVRAWPGSPVHCSDAWGDGFDPSNLPDSRALHVVAGTLCSDRGWNIETQGDILESMLGFCCSKAHEDAGPDCIYDKAH